MVTTIVHPKPNIRDVISKSILEELMTNLNS
jgi:hypothetical protein